MGELCFNFRFQAHATATSYVQRQRTEMHLTCTYRETAEASQNVVWPLSSKWRKACYVHMCTENRETYLFISVFSHCDENRAQSASVETISSYFPQHLRDAYFPSVDVILAPVFGRNRAANPRRVSTTKALALTPELGARIGYKMCTPTPHCGAPATRPRSLIFPQRLPRTLHRSSHKI